MLCNFELRTSFFNDHLLCILRRLWVCNTRESGLYTRLVLHFEGDDVFGISGLGKSSRFEDIVRGSCKRNIYSLCSRCIGGNYRVFMELIWLRRYNVIIVLGLHDSHHDAPWNIQQCYGSNP